MARFPSSLRCYGVKAAMRAFPPLRPPFDATARSS